MKAINLLIKTVFFIILPFVSQASFANMDKKVILTLRFDKFLIPHTTLTINGQPVDVRIDTGSSLGFHLEEPQLQNIKELKKTRTYQSTDASGKVQENVEYIADTLSVNGFTLHHVVITPYKQWGWLMSGRDELPHGPVAGLGAFTDKLILLDYASKLLTLSDNVDATTLINTDFKSFPYQMTQDGLVFDVVQSGHRYRLILDTGATASIIWKERLKSHEPASCLLVDPDMDNEGCKATILETVSTDGLAMKFAAVIIPGNFTHMDKVDGLLGNNFLKNRKILIDQKNRTVYITDEHKKG